MTDEDAWKLGRKNVEETIEKKRNEAPSRSCKQSVRPGIPLRRLLGMEETRTKRRYETKSLLIPRCWSPGGPFRKVPTHPTQVRHILTFFFAHWLSTLADRLSPLSMVASPRKAHTRLYTRYEKIQLETVTHPGTRTKCFLTSHSCATSILPLIHWKKTRNWWGPTNLIV